jgi:hypothetical protein
MLYYSTQAPRDRMGHLADDKLAFRLIEVVYRNLEVELEKHGESAFAKPQGNNRLTGAGPLRIRPAGEVTMR